MTPDNLNNLYLPTVPQIERWVSQIRSLATRPDKKGKTGLDHLEEALIAARKRADAPSPAKDGYPTATMGDGGSRGGRAIVVVDEYGNEDAVPVTSVEATTFDIIDNGDTLLDIVQESAELGCDMLRQAHASLFAAQRSMRHLASVSNPDADKIGTTPGDCLGCGNVVTGMANDRLKRGLGPCCYSTWDRWGRPDIEQFRARRKAEARAAEEAAQQAG